MAVRLASAPAPASASSRPIEQAKPEAPARPAVEALIAHCRWIIVRRASAPATTRLRNLKDTRYAPPVINPARPGLIAGHQGAIATHYALFNQNSFAVDHAPSKNKQRASDIYLKINALIGSGGSDWCYTGRSAGGWRADGSVCRSCHGGRHDRYTLVSGLGERAAIRSS